MVNENEAWTRLYRSSAERGATGRDDSGGGGASGSGAGAAAPPSPPSSSGGKKKGGGSSKKKDKGGKGKKPLRQFPGAPWRIAPTEGPARAAFFPPALLAAAEAADAAAWEPLTAAVLYYYDDTPMSGFTATLRAGGVVDLCDETLGRTFNAHAEAAAAADRASLCLTATRVDAPPGGGSRAVHLNLCQRVER